jgi:AbrB family looped-hinge helix DNA binding protein
MVMRASKVTRKGQVTIPVDIREKLHINEGDTVYFEERDGRLEVLRSQDIVDRTAGALADYAKNMPPITPAQIRELAADAIAEENLETLRQIERDHESH